MATATILLCNLTINFSYKPSPFVSQRQINTQQNQIEFKNNNKKKRHSSLEIVQNIKQINTNHKMIGEMVAMGWCLHNVFSLNVVAGDVDFNLKCREH